MSRMKPARSGRHPDRGRRALPGRRGPAGAARRPRRRCSSGRTRRCGPSYRCGSRWATSSRAASRRVGEALHATLWLRLHLAPQAELRHGVGWGTRRRAGRRARASRTARAGGRPATPSRRSSARRPGRHPPAAHGLPARRGGAGAERAGPGRGQRRPDVSGPDGWLCLGAVVAAAAGHARRQDPGRARRRTRAISASAVSQRVRNDGLAVIVAADELLRKVSA